MKNGRKIRSIFLLAMVVPALVWIGCKHEPGSGSEPSRGAGITITGPNQVYAGNGFRGTGATIILKASIGAVTWFVSDSANSPNVKTDYAVINAAGALTATSFDLKFDGDQIVYVFAKAGNLISAPFPVTVKVYDVNVKIDSLSIKGDNEVNAGNGTEGSGDIIILIAEPEPSGVNYDPINWWVSDSSSGAPAGSVWVEIDQGGILKAADTDIGGDNKTVYVFAQSGDVKSAPHTVTVMPYSPDSAGKITITIVVSGGRAPEVTAGNGAEMGGSLQLDTVIDPETPDAEVIWSISESATFNSAVSISGYAAIQRRTAVSGILSASDEEIPQNKQVYVFARVGNRISAPFGVWINQYASRPAQWDLREKKWEWSIEDESRRYDIDEDQVRTINDVRWYVLGGGHNTQTIIPDDGFRMINNARMLIGAGGKVPATASGSNATNNNPATTAAFDPDGDFIIPETGFLYVTIDYTWYSTDNSLNAPFTVFLNNNTNGNSNTPHRAGSENLGVHEHRAGQEMGYAVAQMGIPRGCFGRSTWPGLHR
jgi:hypothetical protein